MPNMYEDHDLHPRIAELAKELTEDLGMSQAVWSICKHFAEDEAELEKLKALVGASEKDPVDWTVNEAGRSNSSDQYIELVNVVERIIRQEGFSIVNGDIEAVARLIMSTLAHRHGMRPGMPSEPLRQHDHHMEGGRSPHIGRAFAMHDGMPEHTHVDGEPVPFQG